MPSTTKRALITGAGAADGIGFAIARQLGLAGHAVFLNGASARVLDRAAELCAEGINAKAAVADLTIAAEVAQLRADVGAVDILVNNAGMGSLASPSADKAFLAMTEADWDQGIDVSLKTRSWSPARFCRRWSRQAMGASSMWRRLPGRWCLSKARQPTPPPRPAWSV